MICSNMYVEVESYDFNTLHNKCKFVICMSSRCGKQNWKYIQKLLVYSKLYDKFQVSSFSNSRDLCVRTNTYCLNYSKKGYKKKISVYVERCNV